MHVVHYFRPLICKERINTSSTYLDKRIISPACLFVNFCMQIPAYVVSLTNDFSAAAASQCTCFLQNVTNLQLFKPISFTYSVFLKQMSTQT